MSTLADDYPKEQARLRELIEEYRAIGPAGNFGRMMIEQCLGRADRASAAHDTVEMIRCYQEMKGCE